jgi:hypothetical protein
MALPKVLMFTVTYEGKDYCFEEFLENAKKLDYPGVRHIWFDNSVGDEYFNKLKGLGLEVYKVERGNNSREALARGQEMARKMAIDEGYDYLFSLESDIFPPKDIIQGLMTWGKDVCTGLYMLGADNPEVTRPCVTIPYRTDAGTMGTRQLKVEEYTEYMDKGLHQVAAGGMGVCLMHKNAFTKTSFYYIPGLLAHSDVFFFNDMRTKNIEVFVDTGAYCIHKNSQWCDVKDR